MARMRAHIHEKSALSLSFPVEFKKTKYPNNPTLYEDEKTRYFPQQCVGGHCSRHFQPAYLPSTLLGTSQIVNTLHRTDIHWFWSCTRTALSPYTEIFGNQSLPLGIVYNP
jgi:hypothetical protein